MLWADFVAEVGLEGMLPAREYFTASGPWLYASRKRSLDDLILYGSDRGEIGETSLKHSRTAT